MTFKQQRLAFAKMVHDQYSLEEKQSFFYLLTEHHFGYSKFETHQKNDDTFPFDKEILFQEAITRLENNEPIQYIIGQTEFFGLPFNVNQHTLIPRPETEELVALIIEDHENNREVLEVLDIGTGSGCIAISLAKKLIDAKVSGIDVSEGAIKLAQSNATNNSVTVTFDVKDILKTLTLSERYDVIVSNPPYVRNLEKEMMRSNVLDFEPETALFVTNEDPLVFYKKIAQLAFVHLKENGILYLEINEYLGDETKYLLQKIGFTNCLIIQDMYGKDRIIRSTI